MSLGLLHRTLQVLGAGDGAPFAAITTSPGSMPASCAGHVLSPPADRPSAASAAAPRASAAHRETELAALLLRHVARHLVLLVHGAELHRDLTRLVTAPYLEFYGRARRDARHSDGSSSEPFSGWPLTLRITSPGSSPACSAGPSLTICAIERAFGLRQPEEWASPWVTFWICTPSLPCEPRFTAHRPRSFSAYTQEQPQPQSPQTFTSQLADTQGGGQWHRRNLSRPGQEPVLFHRFSQNPPTPPPRPTSPALVSVRSHLSLLECALTENHPVTSSE